MSGGIADTLAAALFAARGWSWDGPEAIPMTAFEPNRQQVWEECQRHAAHQAEVLSSAGYGELSALLDDLRRFAEQAESFSHGCDVLGLEPGAVAEDLRTLLARYALSDPTPKAEETP